MRIAVEMLDVKGMTAISKDTAAFLGIAKPGPIAENARMEKHNANLWLILEDNSTKPPHFAIATIPKTGKIIALMLNPNKAIIDVFPAWNPIHGGNIRFPEPKNIENNAIESNTVSFADNFFIIFPFFVFCVGRF